ncbi:hypothetical protein B9Z52_16320 [Limnohabitans sp. Jir72]|nr:hypothetical protein B9Z52_16320 [Limnohabitans sp. Jir72]
MLLSLALSLLVGCGGGGGGGGTNIGATETLKSFKDQVPTAEITGLSSMAGNPAIGPGGKLYLPTYNSINVFNSVPSSKKTLSDADIKNIGITNPFGGGGIQSVAFAGEKMIVSDFTNNRVLIWNTTPSTQDTTPSVILDKTSALYTNESCSYSYIYQPESIKVIGGNLVIADSGNNRILIYDGIPTSNSDTPSVVLGDRSPCPLAIDYGQVPVPDADLTAATLNHPMDVAYDGEHLVVADTYNDRLLMWTTKDLLSLSNSPQADIVLGQASPTATTSHELHFPWALATYTYASGTRVAVLDTPATPSLTDRVRIWDTAPSCTVSFPALSCEAPMGNPTKLSPGSSYGLAFTGLNQLIVLEEFKVSNIPNRRFSIFNAQ